MIRSIVLLCLAVIAAAPALVLRGVLHAHVDEAAGAVLWQGGSMGGPMASLVFGIAVLAAAFLISWAAELLQMDVSQNLAMAVVALLAVMPEYSVDMYLAFTAATVEANRALALANMTGANRLLIGLGWPAIALAVLWRWKRRETELEDSRWGEVFILAVATVYSFVIPFKHAITLFDTVVLLAIFAWYMRYVARQHVTEPELGGPAELIAKLPALPRRLAAAALFVLAGATLLLAAEPFAEGLKLTGHTWGVSEFLLIQWLAPLASEAPEFIIVLIFALRGQATAAFGALVSSKVNQWTLLVGMIPLGFLAGHLYHGLPFAWGMDIDPQQFGELLLTSAQSVFAVMVVVDKRFRVREATLLLALFLLQFAISVGVQEGVADPDLRHRLMVIDKTVFTVAYLALAGIWIARHRRSLRALWRFVRTGS